MARSPDPELMRAYDLIKVGQRSEAATLLQQFLTSHPYDTDGWWLMAHAAQAPEQRKQCLERVVQLNPQHEKALAALRKVAAPEPAFVPPSDLPPASTFNATKAPDPFAVPSAKPSTESVWGSYDPHGPLVTRKPLTAPPPDVILRRRRLAIMVGLAAIGVVVLIGLILFGMDRMGLIDLDGVPPMTSLRSRMYRMEYPEDWKAQCKTGANDASVCSVYSDDDLNLISSYLSETFMIDNTTGGDALLEAGESDSAVSGIIMDVPLSSRQADTIRAHKSDEESAFEMMAFGASALGIDYRRADWKVDGQDAVFFRLTFEADSGMFGSFGGEAMFGCVASYSLYMPHGDRMLWATFYGYVNDECEKIPDKALRHMLKSIQLVD